ncbi:MAG: four helix bundle protein [Bacteroidia bacterium]|nr:four helix bundle protein [Bacteroidia bacterium]
MSEFMRSHRKLDAWKAGIDFVVAIYRETQGFPKSEMYGLTSQLRRASVSVPSNIAEGAARETIKDNLRFLTIARSSLSEIETELFIAKELGYTENLESLLLQLEKVASPLSGMIRYLKRKLDEER